MNPHILSWENPTQDTDGNAYGQADNAGYTIMLDDEPAISVPLAWGTQFDLDTLSAFNSLKSGQHTAALAVVSKGGVSSAYSSPVTFPVLPAPMAPTNLRLA